MMLFRAVVLGIVRESTAFLPVSATADLPVVPALFGRHSYGGTTNDPRTPFTAIVLGTMLAILGYFWRELVQIVTSSSGTESRGASRSWFCLATGVVDAAG
jgi:undecaprenyl-diphosphatase